MTQLEADYRFDDDRWIRLLDHFCSGNKSAPKGRGLNDRATLWYLGRPGSSTLKRGKVRL